MRHMAHENNIKCVTLCLGLCVSASRFLSKQGRLMINDMLWRHENLSLVFSLLLHAVPSFFYTWTHNEPKQRLKTQCYDYYLPSSAAENIIIV